MNEVPLIYDLSNGILLCVFNDSTPIVVTSDFVIPSSR